MFADGTTVLHRDLPPDASLLDAPPGTTPCRDAADPDLWFAERTGDIVRAKEACLPCPLREECLAGALQRREPWGVWGGQSFVDGVIVAHKRGRGRPPKARTA